MYRLTMFWLLSIALSACSGGAGNPAPRARALPSAAFQPSTITVHASAYDYFGVFAYSALPNGVPKPITPSDGTLACNGGYDVPLQLRAGPDQLGLVRDQYVVLPLLATPPAGTTLTCTSEWGTYDSTGALLATTTLDATIVYDASGPAITFSPSTAAIRASGANAPVYLSYSAVTGFTASQIDPAGNTLACPGGYAPTTQVRAGPGKTGSVNQQFLVNTASITPPAGTKLACTVVYGLFDSTMTLLAKAELAVTLQY